MEPGAVPSFLNKSLTTLNGPNEAGRSPAFWIFFLLVLGVAMSAPAFLGRYDLLNLSSYLGNVFIALGLCLIWGFCGILSLGQAVFLGLGGYVYGIVGINLIDRHDNTYVALLSGLLVPVAFAALLGYFIFYARLKGVFVAILMLVVALLLETFMNQTAGPGWFIGDAHLGGNNGLGRFSGVIREPPSLSFGFGERGTEFGGTSRHFYYLSLGLLVVTYLALRWLVNSKLGYVMIAIREDQERTEALGYNVRLIQLSVFCIGALLAAVSGILYVSWGNFITPSVFGVHNNILPVIWVAVAGRKNLTATVIGTIVLVWLSQKLNQQGDYALVVLGGVLLFAMLIAPGGVIPALANRTDDLWRWIHKPPVAEAEDDQR
jgi:branched-chain amino acid transport system permease protein